jgi:hypothetical protein
MNAYTTSGQARIRHRDVAAILHTDSFLNGPALAALERQREWQAEAELSRLLRQHGVAPPAGAWRVAMLRQAVGAALICAGQRLAGSPRSGVSPDLALAAATK